MTFVFIILFFFMIACLWLRMWNLDIKPHVEQHQRNQAIALAEFNSQTGVLYLKKRGSELAKYFKIKNDKDIEISYKPPTLNVGSATVGGVTTGGAYITGDYHYISGEHKNGLCRLEYTGCAVQKIQLTRQLYAEAKRAIIKKYLNSDMQIEVVQPKLISAYELNIAATLLKTTGYVGNNYAKNGFPDYTKCKLIMDWITS